MRILILNMRDIANLAGGGAETYTQEKKRLTNEYNCDVMVCSSAFSGCRADEAIDGDRLIKEPPPDSMDYSIFR